MWRFAWLPVALLSVLLLSAPRVIDGDTLADGAVRYRVENLDAPELGHRADCAYEAALGQAAKDEVIRLVQGAQRVEAVSDGRLDRYGRTLARILVDGRDLGDLLIARGLARPWQGRSSNFCS
jgi:micrococcal nuclease